MFWYVSVSSQKWNLPSWSPFALSSSALVVNIYLGLEHLFFGSFIFSMTPQHFLKQFLHNGCGAHIFPNVYRQTLAQTSQCLWSQSLYCPLHSVLHKIIALPHQPSLNRTFIISFFLSKHSTASYFLQH